MECYPSLIMELHTVANVTVWLPPLSLVTVNESGVSVSCIESLVNLLLFILRTKQCLIKARDLLFRYVGTMAHSRYPFACNSQISTADVNLVETDLQGVELIPVRVIILFLGKRALFKASVPLLVSIAP